MSWSEIKKKREQETSTPLSKAVNNVTGGLWKQVGQGIIQSNKERQARQKKEEEEKKRREELLKNNKVPAIPTTYERNTPSATQMLVNNPNVKIATPEEMRNTKELNSWNKIKMIAGNAGYGGINGLLGVAQTTERSHQDTRNIANNISTGIVQGLFGLFGDKGKAMGNLALAGSQMITNKEKRQAEEDIESLQQARNKNKQAIAENSRILDSSGDKVASKLGSLAPSIGQQVPGMIATAVSPVAGFSYYKMSSEADYYDDAKERGMNDTESRIYAKLMSYVEAGTETLSAENIIKGGKAVKATAQGIKNSGVKAGLKAGIDIFKNSAQKETANTVKEALKNYGIGIAEEGFQEAITEPIQELTAMTVAGKDKADWNNMWDRMVQSGVDGALSSAIIAGANLGYSSCVGVVSKIGKGQTPTSQEYKTAVKEASKNIDIQKLTEDEIKRSVEKVKSQQMGNQDVNATNVNQPQIQNQTPVNNLVDQQQKVSQNGLSQEQNSLLKKVDAIKDNISEDDYNQLRDMVNNNEYESAEYFNDFVKQVNQMSIEQNYKSSDFRTDQNRKRAYAQYQRQNNTNGIKYNNDIVNNALDTVKANRNGRRTVGQWKQVASQIGLEASDLSKADIDNIAYGSWFDLQPSKNITKYDNRTKERKGFERLTSNEWINAIYESARNQKIQNSDTTLEQYSLSEETPQNNFKYEKSDNAKVDTFRQDASRYWDNSEKTSKLVNTIEKIINDKGYNIRLDDTIGDNVNGRIVTNPETGETEITINPNSNRKGEFIIGHELTHAIETKEMVDLVKSRMQKDGELRNAVEDLKRLYGTDDINAEVLADISGQLFGNQEFINNLSTEKPSVFKRIYDTIVSLANKITGNSNEALFIKDLKNKWEKAYRENTNKITNAEYSLNKDGAMKDNKTGKKVTLQAESMNDGKNLLAIHNLDESKLKGVLELGGFPVPSIAITNPNIVGHSEFGDISVIFNKETINPKSRKNEVYDRDVWSPTIPRIEYEADADNIKSIQTLLDINKNYSEKDDIQRKATRDLSKEEVERMLNNYDGIKGLKDSIKDNKNVQYTYLKSKGLIEPVMKQVQFNNHVSNQVLQNFIDQYPEMTDFSATTPLNELSYEQTMQLSNKIKKIVQPYLEEQYGKYGKDGQEVIKSELKRYDDYSGINNFIYSAQSMLRNGQDLTEIDESATFDKVNEKINKEEFNKWIDDNITDSIIKDKGFDNGKERLTPQGNRRSFKATHNEFNLENLVKALSRGKTKGGQEVSIFGTGFGRISAQTANRFNSIKDIKNNESRLMTREQAQEVIQPLAEQLFEKVDNLANYYTRNDYNSDTVNHMQGVDTTSELIEEFAKGTLSEERLKRILDEYYVYDTDKIPSDLLKGIIEDLKQVKNLPTDYFEAKPQRAVGFDEVDAIVIPKDLSKEVKQQLKDRGIKTIEYDRNNENERAELLKSLNEYKFSKTSKSWQDYLEKNYKSEGTTTDLRDIRLPMKQKQEVTAPMKQQAQAKVKFDNEVMKTNSEIKGNTDTSEKVAKILTEPKKQAKPEQRTWAILKANFIDKGAVFEKLSQQTKNRDLQGKYDYTLTAGARGQYAIGNDRYTYSDGKKTLKAKALTSIIDEVGENTQAFNEYMYHQLNVDRMTLNERFGTDNKPVFGESITADKSRSEIAKIEEQHPEFKKFAEDVYQYLDANKQELVDRGVISEETSDLFKKMYPHYVPIQRVTTKGNSINVPLDTGRTGINTPIKKAKGGNQDINPLFQTMASQTLQTYRASARNNFGLELKNTLQQMNQLNESNSMTDIDEILEVMGNEEQSNELLKKGEKGQNPTFTVFDNGNKVTYEISQDMYDALKPKDDLLRKIDESGIAKGARKISNLRRGVLTEYNPVFSITNAIKDAQDVLMNSQHARKTYSKFPEAYAQIMKKGYWYNEYIQNGGEQNSYFTEGDFENIKPNKIKNALTFPLQKISDVNNVIEMAPRLAEYIVSRENGASIETAMLDASRVTTNFKAGGDITKSLNRNGFTFLNASVQGLQQQIRNIQEANVKGVKGWTTLATKYAIAGLPVLLLNNLFWDDDDDYEQLQDYVKDNYYVVAKLPNGNFLRIPKGRMTATVQKIVSNVNDFVKDGKINADDVASTVWNDLKEDIQFASDNLAPNNPIENNILSPIFQVAQNKTWYGEDLVPQRLQDVPAEEQADESTDKLSKWLGEKLKVSPIKINYLLDQYSGGVGDVLLPLGTPQAENNVLEDKFTTDPVMKSQYPSDFFSKRDELNVKNNSLKATDEDKLKYKYISSVQSEISELYKQKREIQASDKTDSTKKKELKEVQKQINQLAKESLENLEDIKINGSGAKIGDKEFYLKNGTWTKLTDKEKEKLKDTSVSTYGAFQEKTSGKTDLEKIQILRDSNYSKSDKSNLYEKTMSSDKYYTTLKKSGIDIDEYMDYKLAQNNGDFKADKENGKTVMGSAKAKVIKYLNNNITGAGNRLLIAGKQYSLSQNERKKLSEYINKTFTTEAERLEVYEQLKLNFVVNGNKVSYK